MVTLKTDIEIDVIEVVIEKMDKTANQENFISIILKYLYYENKIFINKEEKK